MAEIICQLREEHATMAKMLALFKRQLSQFGTGQPPDWEVIRAVTDYCLTFSALCHHRKEDLVLGKLRERNVGLPLAVSRLEDDHDGLIRLTNRFLGMTCRVLQGEAVSEAYLLVGQDFIDTYRDHMEMEERLFFPMALDALSADDWAEMDARVSDPEDRQFGETAERHFESLRASILGSDGPRD